jgi:hypothetical protein
MQTPAPVSRHLFPLAIATWTAYHPSSSFPSRPFFRLIQIWHDARAISSSSNITSIRGQPSALCTNRGFRLSIFAHSVICERQHVHDTMQ